MAYRGHVENNVIVLDDDLNLPDGAKVAVNVIPLDDDEPLHPDLIKMIGILPPDVDVEKEYYEAVMSKHR